MSLPAIEVATGAVTLPRLVVRATGDAALAFLHDTTSQDLASLPAGRAVETAYLDERGRVLAALRVVRAPDGSVVLDGEEAGREGIERLARIAPLSGVAIEDARLTYTAARGLDDAALAAEAGAVAARGDALLVRTAAGFDVLAPTPPDLPPLAEEAFERARIAAGETRFGIDVEPGMLVNETPLAASAVSHTKGCYPGQESVAKVRNLGSLRRRFALLRVQGDVRAPCDLDDGAGRIASAAGAHAIAVLRAQIEPGGMVACSGVAATVERIL